MPRYCDECKRSEAEPKQASFRHRDGTGEWSCKDHKTRDMVNLKGACKQNGCFLTATNGQPSSMKREFCARHKTPGMVDLHHPMCVVAGCPKQAKFGIGRFDQFCAQHKERGTMTYPHRKCAADGCEIQPKFGVSGGRREYCVQHKLPNMSNLDKKEAGASASCPAAPAPSPVVAKKRRVGQRSEFRTKGGSGTVRSEGKLERRAARGGSKKYKEISSDEDDVDGDEKAELDDDKLRDRKTDIPTVQLSTGVAETAQQRGRRRGSPIKKDLIRFVAPEMANMNEFPTPSVVISPGSGSRDMEIAGGLRRALASTSNTASDEMEVADEQHWPEMRAFILVASPGKKDTSRTAGMSTSVETSPFLGLRARKVVPRRLVEIKKAYLEKDFASFGKITMQDSNQFHATCLGTFPPIFYMNDISRSVIMIIHAYNAFHGEIRAAYTFDAGPNAVVYHLAKDSAELLALLLRFYPAPGDGSVEDNASRSGEYVNNVDIMKEAEEADAALPEGLQELCLKTGRTPAAGDVKMVYYTKTGGSPRVLDDEERMLDLRSGDVIYPTPSCSDGTSS